MTPEQLARIAYDAYCNAIAYDPKATIPPRWTDLHPKQQRAWLKVVQTVKANVLAPFRKAWEG